MVRHTVFISIGSNIGNKLQNCCAGIAALIQLGRSVLRAQSRFYKTEPVDYRDQDWFVNVVVQIETTNAPDILFRELKAIEKNFGRLETPVRFGPRILDLDILLYSDWVMDTAELTVPHPRMHQRRFVLQPMCDIAPGKIHPVLKKDMKTLLDALGEGEQRIIQLE